MIRNLLGIESFLEDNKLPPPAETRCTSFGVVVLRWPVGDAILSCTLRYSKERRAFVWTGSEGHRMYQEGMQQQFFPLGVSRRLLKGTARIVIRQGARVYVEPVK